MKKAMRLSVVLLIVLALAVTTALAVGGYYSVRDYLAQQYDKQQLEQNTTEIGKIWSNDDLVISVNDAFFDAERFALSLNVDAKTEGKHFYLYPTLKAYCGERELSIDIEGVRGGDFWSGFLYPGMSEQGVTDGGMAFDGCVFEDKADADVRWVFTLAILEANWPVVNTDAQYTPSQAAADDMSAQQAEYEAFVRETFRTNGYDKQLIITTWGDSLWEYITQLTPEHGEWTLTPYDELLVNCGAFTLIDTLRCDYDTPLNK